MREFPWDILGVDATVDFRLIRSAYASRLKEIGNDRDAFMRLRDAYEWARHFSDQSPGNLLPAPIIFETSTTSALPEKNLLELLSCKDKALERDFRDWLAQSASGSAQASEFLMVLAAQKRMRIFRRLLAYAEERFGWFEDVIVSDQLQAQINRLFSLRRQSLIIRPGLMDRLVAAFSQGLDRDTRLFLLCMLLLFLAARLEEGCVSLSALLKSLR